MSTNILNFLTSSLNEDGTLVLVGHDGDLDALAVLFGLSWHTKPFPPNATTPGSALRFDLFDGDVVEASVLYQAFDGSGSVLSAPANFECSSSASSTRRSTRKNVASLTNIKKWISPLLDPSCS